MLFALSNIKINGFAKSEILNISAKNTHEFSKVLGEQTREIVHSMLVKKLRKFKTAALARALSDFEVIEDLAQRKYLTIGNVNYAKRYVDSVKGFSEGAGITIAEACFLQKEIESGCQTIIAKNAKNDICFLHTEENGEDEEIRTNYRYRLVKLRLPEKEIIFFLYPGLCSWGPAFEIDKTNSFVQFADEFYMHNKPKSPLWTNFVASTFFDCADLSKIKILARKFSLLAKKFRFHNGYAVHMVQKNPKPQYLSYEIGDNIIKSLPTFSKIFAQTNLPKNEKLRRRSSIAQPRVKHEWERSSKMEFLEMSRKEKRLETVCNMNWWNTDNSKNAIKTGLKVLAYPYGDLRRYRDKKGNWIHYHTGIPSVWTPAHFVGYVGEKSEFYIGKLTPQPIAGMEYSNEIDDNYKYQEEKLWNLIRRRK